LRAVYWLARHSESSHTTEEIAKGTEVSVGYLSKVLQVLGRAGLVTSQRGLRGGYKLSLPPSRVTILDVVNAVDPIKRIRECPLGKKGHGKRLCALHYRLDAALALIEDSFKNCTIEDLCADPTMNEPLCGAGEPGAASGDDGGGGET